MVGIDLDLTSEQRVLLSRAEVAAIAEEGTRFEAVLTPACTAGSGWRAGRCWWKVKRSPRHLPLRHHPTAPVLEAALATGAFG